MEHKDLEKLTASARTAVEELLEAANLKEGQILVVGCSTSEVQGEKIGKASNQEVAEAIYMGIIPLVREKGVFLAVQGCEHINRALVVEQECAEKYNLPVVTVVPHIKAGGGFATAAFYHYHNPVMVESISADAGIDIGDTFIGMHLKPVVIPVRGTIREIGNAHLTMARRRPKLIGGERAQYTRADM